MATGSFPLNYAFAEIRNFLAGKALGITRDKSLLNEVVKCLFSYQHELQERESQSSPDKVAGLYKTAFQKIKERLPEIFDSTEEILLDPIAIAFIHNIFQKISIETPEDDTLSILYQTFIGSEVRGNDGQFFTPFAAVKWLVEAVDPKKGDKIIDPACGAGSFLSYTAQFLKSKSIKVEQFSKNLFGIEKDEYLSRLALTHIALSTYNSANILCGDSIERKFRKSTIPFEMNETFDVVLANPPFGAKIKIGTETTKRKFDLAFKWIKNKKTGKFEKSDQLLANPTPQTLFLELCIQLLKPGGRLGIVVPESMITSLGTSYVSQYLIEKTNIEAVVGMPENLFKTSGKGGTHTKTCLVVASKKSSTKAISQIFMAEAKWCGHDSRGNLIPYNDLPVIFQNFKKKDLENCSHLGYTIDSSKIVDYVLAPRYYNPDNEIMLKGLMDSHDLIRINDLVKKKVIEITTGDEIGKLSYGTGNIPFIRTSDISNWEVKLDPKHGVSEEVYLQYAKKQDVKEGDILMVKDGTYLIGTCAYVSKYDSKIIYQSHLYKIRVLDAASLSPYLLLAALSSNPVKAQIQSKRFTQDIIDTLGKRIYELIIPIPKDKKKRLEIESMVKSSIHDRILSRELARKAQMTIA
jgi:type I restriction enzyme M protein